uniref:Ephrin RBD domain-containing protein n=1 Tax=Panagrellus redivivus TaxID=6233 RepID=A0A7E4V687_PANRE
MDDTIPHDRVNDVIIEGEVVLFMVDEYKILDNDWFRLLFRLNSTDSSKVCDTELYFCYFTYNNKTTERCGKHFTEIRVRYRNRQFSMSACNRTKKFTGDNARGAKLVLDTRDHLIALSDPTVSQTIEECPLPDFVEYPYKSGYIQTIVKFFEDPKCDIFTLKYNRTAEGYEYGKLIRRPTTTTEPPTTTTTTEPPPIPLEPLSVELFILVGCFCGIFNIFSLIICIISGIFRNRRLKKQEALFYSVLRMHYQEQRQLNAASVLKNGKAAPMLTQEAFMANVQKVLDEDRGKEEISAIGDEAATPETFVRFMSLEPLYRHSKGRETPENSTVTTCGDSLAARTASKKKAKDTTKSKTRTAEMVQPPSSDNEWLQLSDKTATPDILSNEKDLKDIQEYNALSQSTWEERIGELDSLTKIIKADLKTHGVTADNSTATTPSTEAISWLQTATSLHRFIAENTSTLSPSVFKLRYKEQLVFLEEQKLSELYLSALLSVEKQHRIAFLQMVFHKFSLLQKPNPKQADKTIKSCHPYPLLDRLSHQFPEYFAIYVKSSEK